MGYFFHFSSLNCICVKLYLNFKVARSTQTHKSIRFLWIVWSTLYVYLWPALKMGYPRGVPRIKTVTVTVLPRINMVQPTDDGHPERVFFRKSQTFGLGQTLLTNWAENFGGIWGILDQNISTHLVQWVPCPCFLSFNYYFHKKLSFYNLNLGRKELGK